MKELIQQLLHEKPFRRIRVILRNGERHEIEDANRVAMDLTRMMVLGRRRTVELKYDEIELVYQPRGARH